MRGLGSVKERDFTYLSIAGGYIWNRSADKNDPDYGEQTFVRADKTEGTRSGAMYDSIDGMVEGVQFKTHKQYGESINITINTGGDVRFILSVSTNNRYSQDLMKALLKGDLNKPYFIKPYDFIGSDKKRASGVTFKQDGQKLELKIEDAPSQTGDWFKNATKKAIKRFFEDLNDWYVAQVEELVVPKLDQKATQTETDEKVKDEPKQEAPTEKVEEKVEEKSEEPQIEAKVSPIKMKRAIKAYIAENYEDETMPKLSGDTLVEWYNLVLAEEELPFEQDETPSDSDKATDTAAEDNANDTQGDSKVDDDELDNEIDALMAG